MSISIHPELEARFRARAAAEGLTVEGYLERLLLTEQQAESELEASALEGLLDEAEESGDYVGASNEDFDAMEREAQDLVRKHKSS